MGLFFAVAIFLLTRQLHRRISELAAEREEQARRLEEVEQLVRYQQERIALTLGEYRLLEVLMSLPDRIHTRTALLDMIQLEAKDVTDRTIDVMLAHMRPKLGAWAAHIETARVIGYRLVP